VPYGKATGSQWKNQTGRQYGLEPVEESFLDACIRSHEIVDHIPYLAKTLNVSSGSGGGEYYFHEFESRVGSRVGDRQQRNKISSKRYEFSDTTTATEEEESSDDDNCFSDSDDSYSADSNNNDSDDEYILPTLPTMHALHVADARQTLKERLLAKVTQMADNGESDAIHILAHLPLAVL